MTKSKHYFWGVATMEFLVNLMLSESGHDGNFECSKYLKMFRGDCVNSHADLDGVLKDLALYALMVGYTIEDEVWPQIG
jgi:hypothetical protein